MTRRAPAMSAEEADIRLSVETAYETLSIMRESIAQIDEQNLVAEWKRYASQVFIWDENANRARRYSDLLARRATRLYASAYLELRAPGDRKAPSVEECKLMAETDDAYVAALEDAALFAFYTSEIDGFRKSLRAKHDSLREIGAIVRHEDGF